MADNVAITAGTGTTIAADDISGVLHQRVKISQGADGVAADVSSAAPLQVTLANTGANTNKLLVTPDLPSGAATAAKQPALGTAGSSSTDVISVQGIASGTAMPISVASIPSHAVTNAGTFAVQAAQSGTWTVQPGNTANTTAWKVDGSAVAQPITDNSGSITVDNGGTFAVQATIAAAATSIGKAEDAAHADGDVGVMALAVRKNTAAATSGSDGDYNPVSVNTRGATWVAIEDGSGGQVTSFSGPTQYTEDVASAADPVGSMMLAVRRDTLSASEVSADSDNIAVKATSKGQVHVRATDLEALAITTGTAGTASSQVVSVQGIASMTPVQATIAAGATAIAKAEDVASADADVGVPSMMVRKATPANSSGTDGDYEFIQGSGGYQWVHDNKGLANLAFSAAFTTLTRPANTTAYTAADSISDNATAGSVTALSATISDINDDPLFISEILVNSTDTGLAGKKVRAYLFNSDPTASSGVTGGDNAAYAQKKAGYIGSFMGWMETGFSDGSVGRLVPCYNETNFTQAGSYVVTKPTSGAKTLFIQYQAVEAFTPSANSTTIIGTARGWQARAV